MSQFMKGLAVVVVVLCIISAISLASTIGRDFNWSVLVSGLLVAALSFGLLYSIGVIIDLLQGICDRLETQSPAKPAYNNLEVFHAPASAGLSGYAPSSHRTPVTRNEIKVPCSSCGEMIVPSAVNCKYCGALQSHRKKA